MKILKQLLLLLLICFVGEIIAMILPIAFPSSVISMLILFGLLLSGALKLSQIEDVTGFPLRWRSWKPISLWRISFCRCWAFFCLPPSSLLPLRQAL